MQLTACTISGNSGSAGAGIYNQTYLYVTAATLIDTIVAGNTAPGGVASDIGGAGASFVTGGYNLIGTGGSGGIMGGSNGNLITADPGLGALTNNGGLTETMGLQPGSPAIGAGTSVGRRVPTSAACPGPAPRSISAPSRRRRSPTARRSPSISSPARARVSPSTARSWPTTPTTTP